MRKVIYKYELANIIKMPLGAKCLTAQVQNDSIFIWAEIDPEITGTFEKLFWIIGTGISYSEDVRGEYFTTVQQGAFVWHIFHADEEPIK